MADGQWAMVESEACDLPFSSKDKLICEWAGPQDNKGQQGQHRCLTLCLAVALRVFYISQVKIIIKRKMNEEQNRKITTKREL